MQGTLCCQIKHRSHRLACVEAHKIIWNCGLVYSIDTEKLHQLILWQEYVQNIASDPMTFQVKWYSK